MSSRSTDGPPYIGAMLRMAWEWVRKRIFSGVVAAGYDDLSPAHVGLFRYPGLDGLRPTELAEQLQITKQSINDSLRHLEQSGYLVREADPADGRARVIRLTAQGRQLENIVTRQAEAAEQQVMEMLGRGRFLELRSGLEELADQIARR